VLALAADGRDTTSNKAHKNASGQHLGIIVAVRKIHDMPRERRHSKPDQYKRSGRAAEPEQQAPARGPIQHHSDPWVRDHHVPEVDARPVDRSSDQLPQFVGHRVTGKVAGEELHKLPLRIDHVDERTVIDDIFTVNAELLRRVVDMICGRHCRRLLGRSP
jgi:hypothetical protein